jgi:toxin ParE1/3/4
VARKYRVDIAARAQRDIIEIWERISKDSPRTADRFIEALFEHTRTLERIPERCPLIKENDFLKRAYRHLLYKKYRILFRLQGNLVYVVRVIHGARLLRGEDVLLYDRNWMNETRTPS